MATSIFKRKDMTAFLLRSGTRQGSPLVPLLSNTEILSPSQSNETRKEIKGIQIKEGEVK